MEGLTYEELEPGRRFRTGTRLVTDADVAAFADLSGDRNPLHLDEAYARASVFGRRVAHGALGLAVATGLVNQSGLTRGTLVAFLGATWDFVAPLYPGTEVRVTLEVRSRRETSRPDRGLVVLAAELVEEAGAGAGAGACLQRGEFRMLVRR
jgi:acyl dehydratase